MPEAREHILYDESVTITSHTEHAILLRSDMISSQVLTPERSLVLKGTFIFAVPFHFCTNTCLAIRITGFVPKQVHKTVSFTPKVTGNSLREDAIGLISVIDVRDHWLCKGVGGGGTSSASTDSKSSSGAAIGSPNVASGGTSALASLGSPTSATVLEVCDVLWELHTRNSAFPLAT